MRIPVHPQLTQRVMRRCRARDIAEAEGRDPFVVLDELLAELTRKLAATAPTDPYFECRIDAVADYAQYVEIQSSRWRARR